MADNLKTILTRRLTRQQLRTFLGDDHDLIKTFENLFYDVTQTIPDNTSTATGITVSLASTSYADSTGFSAPSGFAVAMEAGSTYIVDGVFAFQSTLTVPNLQIGFSCPAGASLSGIYGNLRDVAPVSSPVVSPAVVSPSGRIWVMVGRWSINNVGDAGSAQFRAKAISGGTVTLLAGRSVLSAKKI